MEPISMVPIIRFQSENVLLFGDPMQLPPTLSTQSDKAAVGKGLDKTLFDRLLECEYPCIPLTIQYRVNHSMMIYYSVIHVLHPWRMNCFIRVYWKWALMLNREGV